MQLKLAGPCLAAAALALSVAVSSYSGAAHAQTAEATAARMQAIDTALREHERRFAAARAPTAADAATAYQFEFEGLTTARVPMTAFAGDVVLVVNTASKCGYTPQYEGLQRIYNEYHAQGFEVLGVPSNNFAGQEPGTAEEIRQFCSLNYGVTFPMAGKTEVVGDRAHPFYRWARTQIGDSAVPRWNFHKVLVGRDGRVIAAFPSAVTPTSERLRTAITTALAARASTPASAR
jgi:glutathione peroxidase